VQIPDGAHIELRGVLHFYKMKPLPPSPTGDHAVADQLRQTQFYFDIEEVSFRFPEK
jgi:hypothetical protein